MFSLDRININAVPEHDYLVVRHGIEIMEAYAIIQEVQLHTKEKVESSMHIAHRALNTHALASSVSIKNTQQELRTLVQSLLTPYKDFSTMVLSFIEYSDQHTISLPGSNADEIWHAASVIRNLCFQLLPHAIKIPPHKLFPLLDSFILLSERITIAITQIIFQKINILAQEFPATSEVPDLREKVYQRSALRQGPKYTKTRHFLQNK